MPEQTPEDKARHRLVKLRAMAARPGTPAEGENAKARIEQILTKYPNLRIAPTPPRANPFDFDRWADHIRRQDAQRQHRMRQEAAEHLRRKQADEAWKARMADKNRNGQPLSDAERRAAQDDPLGWASQQDKRSHAQKQADMDQGWGKGNSPGSTYAKRTNPRPNEPRCAKPQSFYDPGGEPRKRNQYVMACEKCGGRMQPGDGAILQVAGVWKGWCAETKPGPRQKRFH